MRLKKGITQEALGDLTQLHSTYISQTERGKRNVSLVVLSKLSKAMDCSISDLLDGVNEDGWTK